MRFAKLGLCLIGCFAVILAAKAETYSSSNFTSADPVVVLHGNYASSANFQLFGSSGPIVIGESTSTNFIYRTGFLYFPLVTAPAIAATAGDSSVQLSWNAAATALGYTVSSYDVGRATNSGGPYTFSNVGNVLSSTVGGLTNGTTYYFEVRVRDFYGSVIATSSPVSATPVASGQNNNNNGGGGGGGNSPQATLTASGRAMPGATVTMLVNGFIQATTQSASDGSFTFIKSLSPGNDVVTFYAVGPSGDRTGSISYTASLVAGTTVHLDSIILSPTVATDKQTIKAGDTLTIFGSGVPGSTTVITIDEIPGLQIKATIDSKGTYTTPFVATDLGKGEYTLHARLKYADSVSGLSLPLTFFVGDKEVTRPIKQECRIADFNCDGKVNLVDFSILVYWFDKPTTPTEIDLNGDSKVDLIDFSILMYYWTGD